MLNWIQIAFLSTFTTALYAAWASGHMFREPVIIKMNSHSVAIPSLAKPELKEGIIIYLLDPREVNNFKRSIDLLFKNYNNRFKQPVAVFYEKSLPAHTLTELKQLTDNSYNKIASVNYIQIPFELPPHYDPAKDPVMNNHNSFPGYNLMIRFFWREVFTLPIIKQYQYYWRLDTDSFILSEIKYDMFKYVKKRNYIYATIDLDSDGPDVTAGMPDIVNEYMRTHKTMASVNNYSPSMYPTMVYNNFEVVNIEHFTSPEIWDFVEHIDRSNKILTRRWGDAPLRFAELNLFFDWKKQVKILCGIKYEHSHHDKTIYKDCAPEDVIQDEIISEISATTQSVITQTEATRQAEETPNVTIGFDLLIHSLLIFVTSFGVLVLLKHYEKNVRKVLNGAGQRVPNQSEVV